MLKKAIIQYKTRFNLKKREHSEPVDFLSGQNIAIIYSDEFENEDQITTIMKELEDEGKTVNLLVFCHDIKKKNTSLPFFSTKDISLTGEIKKSEIAAFFKEAYDFALCFDQSSHYLIDYAFSLIQAKCRIGLRSPDREHFFEMMIHSESSTKPLSSEVLKYLKMVQHYEH